MTGKKWTLLLVSDDRDPLRQFTLEARTLRKAAGGAALFAVAVIVFFSILGVSRSESFESARLQKENAVLSEELRTIRERVQLLEGDLDHLAQKDSEIRILAGMDSIDEEVLQVGVGGPGSPSLEDHPLYPLSEERGKEAFAVAYDLNALERRARLLRESLEEAADSLAAHTDLLQSTPSILPTAGLLTSGFSNARMHPIHNRALPHEGIDISAPRGTPILSAAKGRVRFAGRRSGYGLMVEIDHGYGYTTVYGHASQLLVRNGQQVERGDVIARVGSTGLATSPHLHYEVRVGGRPVNPMNYIITGAIP